MAFEDGVKSIDKCAYTGWKELQKETIPTSLTSINSNPFVGCEKLSSIEISMYNPNYWIENDSLFDIRKGAIVSWIATMSGNLLFKRMLRSLEKEHSVVVQG